MEVKIENSWKPFLEGEFEKPYWKELAQFVKSQYNQFTCYPPSQFIFSALDHCPFDKVKVVIIGQDPYHGPMQANGLCFSVSEGIKVPPSLQNIYKELKTDLGISSPPNGNLTRWADQGILLLNAVLTVRAHEAASHSRKGWELFTDAVIRTLNNEAEGIVFILWGAYAQKKGAMIDRKRHCVLESAHPSPLSAYNGFYGSKPFSKANDYLMSQGNIKIHW